MEKQPKFTIEKLIASELSYWESPVKKETGLSREQRISKALSSLRRVCDQYGVLFEPDKVRAILDQRMK